ncbi:lytic transglycosylase [Acidiferrobacter sp. SPIII_3]|jgi:membrane-bound lytic murein transglycosylase D|uniref:LysM peptidoglycan-binding domain-containing protein n=1 Tax=Acidiferrobacter sp. SPIII_3 TaxID=1281578 RepID=UPI000D72BC67|nr:LysM peptidoglycan-binding domain-containing protein [Acidiferrobacter sp. SPIII_3]AWP22919.1 lytic transglycosylase [Acidiferrobacter sp. SPIII_3]
MATAPTKTLRFAGLGVLLTSLAGCAMAPMPRPGSPGSTSPTNPNVIKTKVPHKAAAHAPAVVKVGECPVPAIDHIRAGHTVDTSDKKYSNLWNRIRAGLRLPRMEGPRVARYEQWFANNPQYVENMLQRANLYLYQIVQDVSKRNMPMEIALLPAIESAYSPDAYSRSAAIGLWQFEPSTGRLWGLKNNWWYNGERDIIASTNAALDFLQSLHNQFHSWDLALAAYNAGQGTVEAAIAHNKALGLGTHYRDLRLPLQTEHYVPKLMAFVNIVRDPAKYGLTLRAIPNSPYFVRVNTGSQVDLSVIARLANMSLKQLYAINPGFTQWATAPNGPHTILVPVATKAALIEGLSQLPPQDRMQWARHRVVPGDTLYGIARQYGVSIASIRSTNHLYGNLLHVGQSLLIPMAGRRLVVSRHQAAHTEVALAHSGPQRVKIIHRVRPGDTLWSIAERYRVYVTQLERWNVLNAHDVLRLGQRILIWASPAMVPSAMAKTRVTE